MKIDNQNDLGAVSTAAAKGTAPVESGDRREASREVETVGNDTVELSGLAGKISQAAGQDATERAALVEQLRAAVAAGRYHPDPADISRGIVNDSLESPGEPRKK